MANIVDIVIKGTDKSKKAIKAPIKNLGDLKTAAKSIGPAFAAAVVAAVAALGVLIARSIAATEELQKTADKLGVTIEALSTLSFAAEIAGTDIGVVEKAMKRLSVQVLDASRGLKEAKDNFRDLGIETNNVDGSLKTTEQLFLDTADAISKLPDGLEKTALAQKVFGKSGAELIPLLNQGAEGIGKMQEKARALGLEISSNTGRNAEELVDNITILTRAFTGAFNVIAKDLLPGLVALTGEFTGAADGPVKFSSSITALTETVIFLGRVGISVASALKAVFEGVASVLASLSNVIFQALTGNFSGVKDAFQQGMDDVTLILETSAATINQTWADSENKRVESTQNANNKIIKINKKTEAELKRERDKARRDAEKIERQKSSAVTGILSNTFSTARSLATDNAKAQQVIASGEAVAQGALAVQRALASAPPPLNFGLAAVVGAATLANIAKINAVGFQDGGVVGGSSFTGDKILAGLNSQEVVLTAANTDNLAGQLLGAGQQARVSAELDGQVFLDFLFDASRDGRLKLSSGAIV